MTFTFAYDVQEGFPAFMGNGMDVPESMPGTYVEILRLVAERVPIELELVRHPWQRCKAYLETNKVDGINSSFRKSREKIGVFPKTPKGLIDRTRRITSDTYQLYALKGSGIYFDRTTQKIINAKGRIMAPLGYSIIDDLKSQGIDIKTSPSGVDGLLTMLSLGRVPGIIAHESQARYVLANNQDTLSDIEATEPMIAEKDYFILVSKQFYQQHPAIAEQIWTTIGELRTSHLPEILERYYAAY